MAEDKPNKILKLIIGDYRNKSLWWWIFRLSLIVLLLLFLLFFIIGSTASDTDKTSYSRSDFVSLCAQGGYEENSEIDIKVYESLCGCIYDRGVNDFGVDKFSELTTNYESSNAATSELEPIRQECSTLLNQ